MENFKIQRDFLEDDGVFLLLRDHLEDMKVHSPPENVFALKPHQLKQLNLLFWSARHVNDVVGCVGLKLINEENAEVKSMRVDSTYRGQGLAKMLLRQVFVFATEQGIQTLWLETGRATFFDAAIRLYRHYGFEDCECFGDYQETDFSRFMKLKLV